MRVYILEAVDSKLRKHRLRKIYRAFQKETGKMSDRAVRLADLLQRRHPKFRRSLTVDKGHTQLDHAGVLRRQAAKVATHKSSYIRSLGKQLKQDAANNIKKSRFMRLKDKSAPFARQARKTQLVQLVTGLRNRLDHN